MRILLVEDDDSTIRSLKKILIGERYTVDIANDGQIGWQLVECVSYNLILLNVVLPGLDGIQFCRQLRAQNNRIPVILMSAQDSSAERVTALNAGADDCLMKPIAGEELLARIRVLLRRADAALLPSIPSFGHGFISSTANPADAKKVSQSETQAALLKVWQKFRGQHYDRLLALKQTSAQFLNNTLTDEQQQIARIEAHKLAGALGIFGLTEGSHLAKEIEQMLGAELPDATLTISQQEKQKQLFLALVNALEQALYQTPFQVHSCSRSSQADQAIAPATSPHLSGNIRAIHSIGTRIN
jgi:DNA-binding response OmpR family regulator